MRICWKLITLITICSCSSENFDSDFSEIIIQLPGSNKAYLYRDGGTVKYEQCVSESTMVPSKPITEEGKFCENLAFNPVPLDFFRYRDALAIAYGIEAEIVAGGLDTFKSTIASLKDRDKLEREKPTPDVHKLASITEKLDKYLRSEKEVQRLFNYLESLEVGNVLDLDADIDQDETQRLLAPFYGKLPTTDSAFKESPDTGLVYVEEPHLCWYDAMGINHPIPCIGNPQQGTFRESLHIALPRGSKYLYTRLMDPNAGLLESYRMPSCQAKYGKGWHVATKEQLQQLIYRENTISLPKFTAGGAIIYSGQRGRSQYFDIIRYTPSNKNLQTYDAVLAPFTQLKHGDQVVFDGVKSYTNDQEWVKVDTVQGSYLSPDASKRLKLGVVCVAPARVANPYGDIDNDGISNINDLCNRIPEYLDAQSSVSGDRIGCVPGQELDSELDFLLPVDNDKIRSTLKIAETQFDKLSMYSGQFLDINVDLKQSIIEALSELFDPSLAKLILTEIIEDAFRPNQESARWRFARAVAERPEFIGKFDQILADIENTLPTEDEIRDLASRLFTSQNMKIVITEKSPRAILSKLLKMTEDQLISHVQGYSPQPSSSHHLTSILLMQRHRINEMQNALNVLKAFKSEETGQLLTRCTDECSDLETAYSIQAAPRYENVVVTYRCSWHSSWSWESSSYVTQRGLYDPFFVSKDGRSRGAWIKGHNFGPYCINGTLKEKIGRKISNEI